MEVLFSAVLGELASRSISFLISRCATQTAMPEGETMDRSLQRMLLRVRAAVEEADRRRVANQAMLLQLSILRDGMYRGYFVLDTFRYHVSEEEEAKGGQVSRSLALSKFNPCNLLPFPTSSSTAQDTKEVERVLESLKSTMADMNEFFVFLMSYPPVYRQPYSMHLLLDKCMFGRQLEMERIMSFLLRKDPPGGVENLDVLPIVGPRGVGKSTLVEHVCIDERVRSHFSRIIYFCESDLKDKMATTLTDGGVTRHQGYASDVERSLVIIELAGDIDDGICSRTLCPLSQYCIPSGSKVIVTSRSDMITSFGTTQALSLKFLPREAYWYFFKVLVFGSADPEEQPRLASIAMGIFQELSGTFLIANVIAGLLRDNVSPQSWCRIHARVREWRQKNLFGAQPRETWSTNTPTYLRRIDRATQHWVIHKQYQIDSSQIEVPGAVPIQEAMSRSYRPEKKIELLAWRSHVPPYFSYMFSCEIQEPQCKVIRKRRNSRAHSRNYLLSRN